MKFLLLITLICSFSLSALATEGEASTPDPQDACTTANGDRASDTPPPPPGDRESTPTTDQSAET